MSDDDDAANYDEFSMLERYAQFEGVPWTGRPAVRRETRTLGSGTTMSAIVWGTDDPELVLLHGGGQNSHTWDSVALLLGRPLAAIDLPGHGHSDWREDGDYAPPTSAVPIGEMIEQIAPKAKAVVGMSMGGLTAISLAAGRSDLVPRAVIVDVTPGTYAPRPQSQPPAPAAGQPTQDNGRGAVDLIRGPATFDSFQAMLDATSAMMPGRPIESLRPGVLHNARRLDDGRWAWRYDRLDRHQLDESDRAALNALMWQHVSDLSAPILLVRGGRSPFVTDEDAAEFVRRHPETRVELVENAGHSVQSDQARRLAELIDDFTSD